MPAATTMAIVGTGLSAATTGASFAQAAKQRDLERKAEYEAKKSMEDARRALEKNYYEGIAIPKEAYEISAEILKSTSQLGIEAAKEGDPRQLASTVSRIQQQGLAAAQQLGAQMEQAMYGLDIKQAQAASEARDKGIILDLAEVEGAQEAAALAEQRRASALQQGLQGLTATAAGALQLPGLYRKTDAARDINKAIRKAGGIEGLKSQLASQAGGGDFGLGPGIQGMSENELRTFLGTQDLVALGISNPPTTSSQIDLSQFFSNIFGNSNK